MEWKMRENVKWNKDGGSVKGGMKQERENMGNDEVKQ